MKTLKDLRVIILIAFMMALFLYAFDSLIDEIPAFYELYHILIEIAFVTGLIFVIYSGIYFFLRLVFYLLGKKKSFQNRISVYEAANGIGEL